MKKIAFLLVLVFCASALLGACGKGEGTTTTSTTVTTATTGKGQTTQTSATIPSPTFVPEDIQLAEGQKLISQIYFDINAAVDYKAKPYKMRVALISADKALGGVMWYIDLLDEDGKTVASSKRGGYGFIAVNEQKEGTNILIYNINADETGRFNVYSSINIFSNYDKTGALKESIGFNVFESYGANGYATKEGVTNINFLDFAQNAHDICDRTAWNVVLMCSPKTNYVAIPDIKHMVDANVKSLVKAVDGDKVIAAVEAYFGKIEG